jgi:hypothetical protein
VAVLVGVDLGALLEEGFGLLFHPGAMSVVSGPKV